MGAISVSYSGVIYSVSEEHGAIVVGRRTSTPRLRGSLSADEQKARQ